MTHALSGDQCQYKNLLSGVCLYQFHSTPFHKVSMRLRIIFSAGLFSWKYCLAHNNPCIKNAVSTKSPPSSRLPKKGTTFPVSPSIKCENAPWNFSAFIKKDVIL